MGAFETRYLPEKPDVVAPDGSNVRVLSQLPGGSMAHFELPAGQTSCAVGHRTVEELWYILGGTGEMWRRLGEQEAVVDLKPGMSITIPVGTHFQFRATGVEPLTAVGVTMPPWPGHDEAYEVSGPWAPTV